MADAEEIARRWTASWETASPREFAEQYTPDGVYIDHAFRINRTGRAALEEHAVIWHRSIEDFTMTPRDFFPTEDGMIVTYLCRGRFVGDLPAMRATGRDVVFHGIVHLTIDDDGSVARSEEWYSTTFAAVDGVEVYPPIPAGARVVIPQDT